MDKKKKKKVEKTEEVQVMGPEELAHLSVKDVLGIFSSKKEEKPVPEEKVEKFEHYYTAEPTSELHTKIIQIELKNGHVYNFTAPSGVYGKKRVDKATDLLVNTAEISGKKLLDIGCGYGVIGITLKKENPFMQVYMSDINKRAVEFSKINAKDNNAQVTIKWGNIFDPWEDEKFDVIISNPPIVAGKNIWMNIIKGSFIHLNPEGSLQLVAFHNKGGERISQFMKDTFGNMTELIKSGGIRVYKSVKEE
ncbi:MAG TPA: methyltransferase [Petrotogaceae bacterium]|jgi:16S rRNA G1207 methylase RsmC|nr:class I SAM-dependent methyltransferase [Petrotogaceae bacterium]HNV06102.1 methyltransferase [Petrotogaceae bacterium]HNY38350.1 methyltransferase [Petrotogaceae bacterium]HOG35288.1 methyltransferase [Petrotogaceae bacterium]HPO27797.1 methyltransferase [Petrotogaceae bacterium]